MISTLVLFTSLTLPRVQNKYLGLSTCELTKHASLAPAIQDSLPNLTIRWTLVARSIYAVYSGKTHAIPAYG
jgi:hypothetical protein